MAWLDYAFLGMVLLSVMIGFFRGLVRETLSLATWIVAFVATLRYGPLVSEKVLTSIHTPAVRIATAYALVFFVVLIGGAILTYLVNILVRNTGLRSIDRMLGTGFGLARGALLAVALVMIAGLTSLHEENWWQASRLAPKLKPAANSLQRLIPQHWLAYLQSDEHKSDAVSASEH